MKKFVVIATLLISLIATMPVVSAELMSLVYDANGNLVSGDGKFRTYNDFNQLVEVYNGSDGSGNLLERYEWDPVQERILIKDVFEAGSLKETTYYINKNFYQVENISGLFNFTSVYQNGILIAENSPPGKTFFSNDPFGSSALMTNSAGVPIENTTMDPHGNILIGGTSRFDYEDKEFSSLTGDYDFNFRKFNPTLKIFTQPDTLMQSVFDPQLLNRYEFERNSPYVYIDPSGHISIFFVGGPDSSASSSDGRSGMNEIVDQLPDDIKKQSFIFSTDLGADVAFDFVVRAMQRDPAQPITIVGHSYGGTDALDLQNRLQTAGYRVNYVATIDAIPKYENPATLGLYTIKYDAATNQNFVQVNPFSLLHGQPLRGVDDQTYLFSTHTGLDNNQDVQKQIVDAINAAYSKLGVKNVFGYDSKTGTVGVDKGKLTRARVLAEGAAKRARVAKNRQ